MRVGGTFNENVAIFTVWNDNSNFNTVPDTYMLIHALFLARQELNMFQQTTLVTFPTIIANWIGCTYEEAMNLGNK